jgi:hypothetical protein
MAASQAREARVVLARLLSPGRHPLPAQAFQS